MKSIAQTLTIVSSFLAGSVVAFAQMEVRNAVSDNHSNAQLLFDGAPELNWQSQASGDNASFLLADPGFIEAEYVLATGVSDGQAYQILASDNYRDWILVSEGVSATTESDRAINYLEPLSAQYVRFISQSDVTTNWEMVLGDSEAVEAGIAFMKPIDWGNITDPENIANMLERAFDWQVAHETRSDESIGWISGAFYTGVSGMYELTGLEKYRSAIIWKGTEHDWTLRLRTGGKGHYHADDHAMGQAWLELYMEDPDPQELWIADVQQRLDRVMANPLPGRADLSWCDALYMSPPNYVRLAEIKGDDSYRTFIDTQWWDVTDFLYDTEYHLFYRDSSYFDDREPNGAPVFWSRGNGWVVGGLVRMLQYLPENWPKRVDYITLLEDMSAALVDIQGEDGLWSTSILYPERYNFERETSGSAFFTYAMAWGVNQGILDAAVYGPVIEKAWAGLVSMLNGNGTLQFIQQVGAGPAKNNGLYEGKDYGYGAFLLAGTEMIRYYVSLGSPSQLGGTLANALPGNPDGWSSIDDFEGAFDWNVQKTVSQSEQLEADPYDLYGSHVFSVYTGDRTPGVYRATAGFPVIENGTTGTVYQRFAYNNIEIDVVFGASDEAVVDAWGDYETGLRVYFENNVMEARSGSTYVTIGDDFLQLGTWYETWTVIDNDKDQYDVYIRGGSNYPEITLLQQNIPFRNGTSKAIQSYSISYNTQYCEGSFFLDDIHVDPSGVNLSRPAGVHQTWYSPWASLPMERPSLAKTTDVGALWDTYFPWIYHRELDSWCYLWPQEVYDSGYWAWKLQPGSWVWLSSIWDGWWYDYTSGMWSKME